MRKRGEYKATDVLIAGLFVSMTAVVIMSIMASGSQEYDVTYDNNTYEAFNKFEEISATTKKIQDQTDKAGASSNPLDILGVFFNEGYQALKLTKESFGATDQMIQAGTEKLPIGSNASIFRGTASAVLIIIIFIGIILAAIIKRNL